MDQIQILTDKQVRILHTAILPELRRIFDKKENELRDKALAEIDNFKTTEEYLKEKERQDTRVERLKKLIELNKTLKEIDKNLIISNSYEYGWNVDYTEGGLKEMLENNERNLKHILVKLSESNCMINASWSRQEQMSADLRAKLSTSSIYDFEYIKKDLLDSFDVNKYFNYIL